MIYFRRKLLNLLFLMFIVFSGFAQEQLLSDSVIAKLNARILSFETDYKNSKTPIFNSFQQTTADYFEIVTKKPELFLEVLKKVESFQQLVDNFEHLQIDKNLFIVKSVYLDYKNVKKIDIHSFRIENSWEHSVIFEYSDSLNQDGLSYYHSEQFNKKSGLTTIEGFYLGEKFQSVTIPEKYADWIHYTDVLVKPEIPLFFNKAKRKPTFKIQQPPIDTMVTYFEERTGMPIYDRKNDYLAYREILNKWEIQIDSLADSLYEADSHFSVLLQNALTYAEKNKVSNGYVEDFTAKFISIERALHLMRLNRQVGSCSMDNNPVIQQKRIAKLAASSQNWVIFIKSFLNILNDKVARVANSNIASNARKTYIEELIKLDLDINKILLGSNFKIVDDNREHYFSNGEKIAKAFAGLDVKYQRFFEETMAEILMDSTIDAFNKLHFFNTYKHYQYAVKDSLKSVEIGKVIDDLVSYLPVSVKSRINYPHKQLYDLLHAEQMALDSFVIKSSMVGYVYSSSFSGNCWIARLAEKGAAENIVFELVMPISEKITPLQNFLDKKDYLKSRVKQHGFLQKILNTDSGSKLHINFTKDKSFVDYKGKAMRKMPEKLVQELDFENALSGYISFSKIGGVGFLLLSNDNLLLLGIPKGFTLPGYTFEELVSAEKKSFISISYKSYKLFNRRGEMLN